jgi:hypothetical protein
MRRVVVTGLGIVSSIGNNAEEVQASLRDAKSGITFSTDFAEHGFRCQVWGAPTLDPTELVDRRAMRFLRKGGAGTMSPCSRRSPTPAWKRPTSPTSAPASSWAPAAPRPAPSSRPPTSPEEQGPQAHRPVRRAEGDVVDRLRDARHLVQDQGRQLFDLLGLRDLGALHRQCL